MRRCKLEHSWTMAVCSVETWHHYCVKVFSRCRPIERKLLVSDRYFYDICWRLFYEFFGALLDQKINI